MESTIKPLYIMNEDNAYVHEPTDSVFTDDKLEEARKWSEDNFTHIILPREANSESINDIEKEFIEYQSLPLKQRRIADWKALELFGKTNQDIYEEFIHGTKSITYTGMEEDQELYLTHDRIALSSEAVIDMSDQVDYNRVNYTNADIETAREWAETNGLVIITPCSSLEDLERLWDNFNSMLLKHRNISDWESEKIFGMTNLKHYNYLKSKYLKDDIEDLSVEEVDKLQEFFKYLVPDHFSFIESYIEANKDSMSSSDMVKILYESTLYDNSTYYKNGINKVIKRVIENEEISSRVDMDFLPCSDLPFYSPEEMIDMGVFSHADADNYFGVEADNADLADGFTTQGWFEAYKYHFNGFDTPNRVAIYKARLSKLTELCFGLARMKRLNTYSERAINARKQSILELGWNPELEFTPENRVKTNKLYIEKCNAHISTHVIDMRGFGIYNETEIRIDKNPVLKPLYIVLTGGKKVRSNIIKAATLSKYSHCSIALDASLEELFSYDGSGGNGSGGFVIDSINNYEPDQKLGIFTIFVKNSDFDIIKKNIEYLKTNIKDTAYSVRNLLSYAFHFIPIDKNNLNSFCSQFVDRLLKTIGVDITKRKSEYVAPNTFSKAAKKNSKIFNMYEGIVKNFNGRDIEMKTRYLVANSSNTTISIKKENFDIARSFLCHSTILNEMVGIDKNSVDNTTRSIFETYIEPYIQIDEFAYKMSKSFTKKKYMSMDRLDSMIKIFG